MRTNFIYSYSWYKMLPIFGLLLCFTIHSVASSLNQYQYPIQSCRIGDVIQNDCIKCYCSSRAIFECKPKDCNQIESLREIVGSYAKLCIPNQLYVLDHITCICNENGMWPHDSCREIFQALPLRHVKKQKCKPNTYKVIDCNVCRCGPDGEIIPNRCTKNVCNEVTSRRNIGSVIQRGSVYSNCEINNWYSLAPCQFCYCINENRLVCNTGNYYNKKIELGTYDLQVCGTELINEALELIPEEKRLAKDRNADSSVESKMTATSPKMKSVPIQSQETSEDENDREKIINSKVNQKKYEKAVDADNDKADDEKAVHVKNQKAIPQYEDDEQESYSDEEDITKSYKTTVSPANVSFTNMGPLRSGLLPGDDEVDIKNNNDYDTSTEDDDSKEKSNEIPVDLGHPSTATINLKHNNINNTKITLTRNNSIEDLEYNGETLQINLPNVLNKVFQMALRKSMVSISKETECLPGSTTMNGCNMCFCLKNSKLLCTANKCPQN